MNGFGICLTSDLDSLKHPHLPQKSLCFKYKRDCKDFKLIRLGLNGRNFSFNASSEVLSGMSLNYTYSIYFSIKGS